MFVKRGGEPMRRASAIVVFVAIAFGLSGCGGWFGTITFQYHINFHGSAGVKQIESSTTYTIDKGSALAKVTSTQAQWLGSDVPSVDANGCEYFTTYARG